MKSGLGGIGRFIAVTTTIAVSIGLAVAVATPASAATTSSLTPTSVSYIDSTQPSVNLLPTSTNNSTYGRTDDNGLPEIESVTDKGSTGYVLHDPTGKPVMLQTSSGVTCLYLYDGIGNPIGLSTSASTTSVALQYDPYGATTRTDSGGNNGGWTENPYLFQGGTQDRITGQVKFGQRWYNPATGTWTQQDTLNAPLDPANANRYAYSAGDPIDRHDLTGRDSCVGTIINQVGAGAGALLGVLGFVSAAITVSTGGVALAVAGLTVTVATAATIRPQGC